MAVGVAAGNQWLAMISSTQQVNDPWLRCPGEGSPETTFSLYLYFISLSLSLFPSHLHTGGIGLHCSSRGVWKVKWGTKVMIYIYYCLISHLGFGFYTASWWSFFQNASLSIILRQKLIETIELSLQLPEERCHQGSFAFNHNPVLALKPWGLQANSGRCWFHRRETYSVLVNDSSSYATNSWPELLWKRLLRLWVNSCTIAGVRILEFQSEIACNITHSFFLYSFHVIIPNPKCKVPLSSPLSVDIVWSIVDRETAQAYTGHMH